MENSSNRSGYVAEWCPNCNTEIEMAWDVEALGLPYYWDDVFGKTVFLTREEAERTLEGV